MFNWLERLIKRKASVPAAERVRNPRLLIVESCLVAMSRAFGPTRNKGHEGIAYLLGLTDGHTTLVAALIAPEANTTRGSFEVGPLAMSTVVRAAADRDMQVVGQVHTHPGEAFHSRGDIDGTRMRYQGYASVVLPDYGRNLPSLAGCASYIYDAEKGFIELKTTIVVPGEIV